ncbi:glycine--tRNA ligase, mitochondrial 1-like protein [Tanacetum coccineum]
MLEVDCPCVTPEVVLKASGHVDKFTDLMVKDEKKGTCYRADHLLKDHCKDKLEKDLAISSEMAAELKHILAVLDDLSAEQLGAKIKEYGIVAPDSKNPLSDPYPFNLMFATSIGPSGMSPGTLKLTFHPADPFLLNSLLKFTDLILHRYMRPETAQGIFVNFKDLYYYNGNKLPFAAAQIDISRQTLLRVREFTLAEIEHFVDPDDKSHPKYSEVSNLEFLMFPRDEQMSCQAAKRLCLGDAVSKGIVNNQTLAYFIGRIVGMPKLSLRTVGLSESDKSGIELEAQEKFAEPKVVEKLDKRYNKKEIGLAFKGNGTIVIESLEALNEKEAMEMKETLESKGEVEFEVCKLQKTVTIKKNIIIYCLYEHSFYMRPSKAGDEQLNVFPFPPLVPPIKCTVFPLVQNQQYEEVAKHISRSLTAAVSQTRNILLVCTSIGKRYARTDELGVPFAVTVDSTTSVTIRERDSKDQIRVNVDEVAVVVKDVCEGRTTWADILQRYPAHTSASADE